MKSSNRIALALLICVLGVAPAFADSDSSYCTGKGYIAFDLRSFIHPDLNAPHVLRLFKFDSERGIYKAAEWPMKDFQVHAMWCTRNRIVVAGSEDARYVFDIVGGDNRDLNASGDNDVASSDEGQLGWSVAGVKTLESSDREHKYQLVLSNSTKGSVVTWRAELIQVDSHQKVSQRVVLYERQDEETGE
jgi:hypothetical protein